VPGRRLIPLLSICETPRSSPGLRVSSFEPRLRAQEFGLWHPLDSWLIPHVEPLTGSARGIDCVSMRAALLKWCKRKRRMRVLTSKKSQNTHPLVKQTPKGCGTQDPIIASRVSTRLIEIHFNPSKGTVFGTQPNTRGKLVGHAPQNPQSI
jgi:hypothetical protein